MFTRGTGLTIKWKDMEILYTLMETHMKVSSKAAKGGAEDN